jgi:hypothetical protein
MSDFDDPKFTTDLKLEPTPDIDGLTFYTSKQFLDQKVSIDWLLEGYLHRGSLALLVAPPKHNKTTFILAMGGALSTGGVFLEKQCKKSRVLFLCLEGGVPSLLQAAKDMKLSPEGDFFITTARSSQIQNPVECMRKLIVHFNPDIIFVDPMIKWHQFDEKSYSSSLRVLGEYSDLAKELRVCIFFVHHSPKSSENGHDGVNGSVGIWGTVDSKFHFQTKNGTTYFHNDQRNSKSSPTAAIYIDRENGLVSFIKPPATGPEERIKDDILSLLDESLEPTRMSAIKRAITGKSETITLVIEELLKEGLIHEHQYKGRGEPRGFSLMKTVVIPITANLMAEESPVDAHRNVEDDFSALKDEPYTKEEYTEYLEISNQQVSDVK